MIDTKAGKVEFGQSVYFQNHKRVQANTQTAPRSDIEIVKMIQKGEREQVFSGYRKINYADEKIKETYRKINKMLGGC